MANLRDNILVEMKNREIPEIFNASNFFKESEISVKIGEQTYSKKLWRNSCQSFNRTTGAYGSIR